MTRRAEVTDILAALLPGAMAVSADAVETASGAGGAYALAMHIAAPVRFRLGKEEHLLARGQYVYAGSAYGPGGLRARLRRHFRRDKALHWHVDRLTAIARSMHAFMIEGGSECVIAAGLARSGAFRHSVAGFGSSDCSACSSHLLLWCAEPFRRG